MAAATVYHLAVQLSHVDRGVYETIDAKIARPTTETDASLAVRMLAYCLEFAEGIAFGPGLNEPDEPTIAVRDLTGALQAWIDTGVPDAARLHKASKAAPRVAVYTHRPAALLTAIRGEKIHRAAALELWAPDAALIDGLAERLDRRLTFDLSVTDGHVYLTIGGDTLEGDLVRLVPEA